eukprot:TRINITY_DN5120_c0_g1_i16.p1 TRINITY_DN5120_c0_g1~~TRINITY_DN5120_c0_g1_i16.p1  ORF type:complete len:129 (+),score=28.36 TRINITY_DN5120_c0_g1_i16:35-388(+)
MWGQPENICEETVHIVVDSNQDVKEEKLDSAMCQNADEIQEYAAPDTENDIKEEDPIYIQDTDVIQTTEFKDVKEEIIQDVNCEYSSNDKEVFTCDVCEEVFSEKVDLFMHKDLNHS